MTASTERQDYRCGVCQMKNVFHCEHDTPYRDQYLNMFDPKLPRNTFIDSKNSRKKQSSSSTSASGQHANYKSTDRNKKTTATNGTTPSTDKDKQTKTKSCVIL